VVAELVLPRGEQGLLTAAALVEGQVEEDCTCLEPLCREYPLYVGPDSEISSFESPGIST